MHLNFFIEYFAIKFDFNPNGECVGGSFMYGGLESHRFDPLKILGYWGFLGKKFFSTPNTTLTGVV
ncbi:MAG: hypothetical protein CM15mP109_04390 [Candidatus Dadabacteria bacterium]|nr:MAG: hypothetical protein CM15mP109_04390 [Candidatus Dadabacteria bacterium]